MPKAASKRQFRMMMAILHGKKVKDHPRGRPPKNIAAKYSAPDSGAPESKNNDRGGSWKNKDKKKKKNVKKTFEQYYRGQGAGVIVLDKKGRILVGECCDWGSLSTPGGHVDPGEDFIEAAHRETREEAGIVCQDLQEIGSFRSGLNDSKVFVCRDYKGKIKDSDEMKNWRFVEPHVLVDDKRLRQCSLKGIQIFLESSQSLLKKTSLKYLVTKEKLEKNILRGPDGRDAVYDVSHGDALRLVGNGAFRMLREAVSEMQDEDFKDIILDGYVLSIRKHLNDMYSGRISDGQKIVHQFSHKSLPALTADIMSVFEWYLPEDEPELQILGEENLPDDAIEGGLQTLIEEHKRHNLANIYTEMENMRTEIRHGNATDIQQVEERIMKLFDKLEKLTHEMAAQHNKLCEDAGNELELLESKLLALQSKVEELHNGPSTVEAFSANPANPDQVYNNEYMYLPKPQVIIEPNGRIKITFGDQWNQYDKENFLQDLRARAVKRDK